MVKYELSQHAKAVIKELGIQVAWLEQVLDRPTSVMDDAEDALLKHAVGPIAVMDHRILRVIYNDHVEPVRIITACFDRTLRNKL